MIDVLRATVRTVPDFPTPGIQFRDITPILAKPELVRFAVKALVEPYRKVGVTKVLAVEARGFILGPMLAEALDAGFIPVRKSGKLPYTNIRETYALEYGNDTIEMHIDAVGDDDVVLIHDDLIATGGTAAATFRLAVFGGASVAGFAFLVELDALEGRLLLEEGVPVHSLVHF